jgi:cilia- and flagella-associated protein 52
MSLDFEHFIGLNAIPQGACFHPDGQKFVFSSGATVVIGDLLDPHSQEFLRGHDDNITALAVSKSGTLLASGQRGINSDILIWDYQTRSIKYRFEEHDHMIQGLAFSEDEKILASIGNAESIDLIFWDMSNGCIISSAAKIPIETTCISFAGFIKNIKRRDTNHYQIYTGGKEGIMLWDLDPHTGELQSTRVLADARATITRHITGFALSHDYEHLYAATTSGDYVYVNVRTQRLIRAWPVTRLALLSILFLSAQERIIVGGGDKSLKIYNIQGDLLRQTELDGAIVGLSLSHDELEVKKDYLITNSPIYGILSNTITILLYTI